MAAMLRYQNSAAFVRTNPMFLPETSLDERFGLKSRVEILLKVHSLREKDLSNASTFCSGSQDDIDLTLTRTVVQRGRPFLSRLSEPYPKRDRES